MKNYLTPALALSQTIESMEELPSLGGEESRDKIVGRYEYVVVRDALNRLGIPFETADWFANHYKGCIRERYKACTKNLGIPLTRKAT